MGVVRPGGRCCPPPRQRARSSWGRLGLTPDCTVAAGPPTLLVRREQLTFKSSETPPQVELPVGEQAQVGRHIRVAAVTGSRLWAVLSPSELRHETMVDALA